MRLNRGETAVRKFPCYFPAKARSREENFPATRCRKEDNRMSKYLIEMCFPATGGIASRPKCDFFPDFSLPAGNIPLPRGA